MCVEGRHLFLFIYGTTGILLKVEECLSRVLISSRSHYPNIQHSPTSLYCGFTNDMSPDNCISNWHPNIFKIHTLMTSFPSTGHTHTHTHTHTQTHTHIRIYIFTYIHTYIYTYIRTYINTYIHTYIHACIHTYIHTHIHVHVHVHVHVNVYTDMHGHTHAHTYT